MSTTQEIQTKSIPFGGILLVLAGLFILIQQFFSFEITGSVFMAGLALFFILWGATQRKAGLLIPGGILTGLSFGIFMIEDSGTLTEYMEGGVMLFSLAAGFAIITLLARLFTTEKHWWALIVAGILTLIGSGVLIAETPEAHILKPLVTAIFNAGQYFWPVIMIILGIWIIFKRQEA